ncbi:MAG: beta-ketoacyl-ACP synthase II [Planctomycetota bacterium]|jgi:3-oxoacyl-[acyl-carrier-protein] synthase II
MTTAPSRRRVVVTGLGVITGVGHDVSTTWSSLVAGRSGVGPITYFDWDDEWSTTIAGEVRDWDPEALLGKRESRKMDRFCLLAMHAADEAARDCGIDFTSGDPTRRGVVIGSGVGGIETIENATRRLMAGGPRKMNPFTVPRLMVNAAAGNVSIRYDLRGANSAVATACATGGHAIGTAAQLIERGDADVMFAGGSEAAVTPICISSFSAMKALSKRNDEPEKASRPFDRDRDGFVLAEGAGIVVLESLEHAVARGAMIYAEVCGYGTSGDAQHIAAPDEHGDGARAAMSTAIADAGISLEDIGYINAHGTSTPLGDAAEVAAVKGLFGDHARHLAMSSTKSMTGHTLGAAGGIESIAVIKAVQEGVLPPTINLDSPDDGFDLDFVANEAQERRVRYGLNNSFGFGGHNVSVVFGRFEG